MKELMVDGEKWVRAAGAGDIKLVVLERGFIYIGRVDLEDAGRLTIFSARSVIRWGTTKHLGELVNGPLNDTKLGDPCTVQARWEQVIHTIEVNQDGWKQHID